jgi:hypothetical protein
MTRRIFILSYCLVLSTMASNVSSAEYKRYSNLERVAEVKDEKVTITDQKPIVRRVGYFARSNGCPSSLVVEFAEAISATSDPETLAAICAAESNFNPKAKGKDGDSGAFQVMPNIWGSVPRDISGQSKQADGILQELLRSSGLKESIRRYNGSGKKATEYSKKVMRLRAKV